MLKSNKTLSPATSRIVDWDAIQASAVGVRSRSVQPSDTNTSNSDDIQRVFEKAQVIFDKAVDSLEDMTKYMYWIVGGTIAFVVAATILSQLLNTFTQKALAVGFSFVGIGVLLSVAYKLINAHRDIVILKLVPTKYAMGLQLATTPEQKNKLFDGFMKDLESLQNGNSFSELSEISPGSEN